MRADLIMKLIVGLGNPGRQYAKSRHNVGFQCLDELAGRHGLAFTRRQSKAEVASGQLGGVPVLLARPQTFMNDSGEAVAPLAQFYKVTPSDLLVVYDDLDLPIGKMRLRPGGSSAGHRGVQSIVDRLGRQDFPRLRVGIGRPAPGVTDPASIQRWVLSEYSREEKEIMERLFRRATEAIYTFATQGIERAMNDFNRDPAPDEAADERR